MLKKSFGETKVQSLKELLNVEATSIKYGKSQGGLCLFNLIGELWGKHTTIH